MYGLRFRFCAVSYDPPLKIIIGVLKSLLKLCRVMSKDNQHNVTTTPFNSDHFLVIFESNLSLKSESEIFDFFSRSKFSTFSHALNLRDLALAEWFRMYQCDNGNDMFESFINIFEKNVEKHAPIQSVKKGGEIYENSKPWLTRELKHLITQKHFLFNKWKKFLTARRTENLSA